MPAGLYSLQKCRGPMLTNDAPGFKAILHNAFHNTLKFLKKHLKRFETHVTSKCLRVSLTALALSKGLKEWLLREVCEAGVASTSPATRSATSPSSCPLLPDSKHLPRYGKTVRFYMVLHWTWFYSTKGACLQHLKTSVSWGDQRTIRTEICTTSKHPKAKAARKSSSLVPKKTTLKLYRHSRPQRDHDHRGTTNAIKQGFGARKIGLFEPRRIVPLQELRPWENAPRANSIVSTILTPKECSAQATKTANAASACAAYKHMAYSIIFLL